MKLYIESKDDEDENDEENGILPEIKTGEILKTNSIF